ncbi:partial heptose III glucuronosyltransferase, partial [Gammaproteobacteria bacterium]
MRFSVVIPTFNRKDILRQCLKSLQAQDFTDFEVLVVDGGNDGTEEMLAREFPGFRYLREERSGPSVARNLGIEQATGEIVAFTDDDCLPPPDWLSKMADGYRRYPTVSGVAG